MFRPRFLGLGSTTRFRILGTLTPVAPRRTLGSWLEGTPRDAAGGSRFGLPAAGPGSPAGMPRRLGALGVDWLLSMAISGAFFRAPDSVADGLFAGAPLATLAVFGLSTAVLVGLLGHTIGHRLLGIRVVRLRDLAARTAASSDAAASPRVGPPGLGAALVRTAALCLVIPPVVWDSSGRGLHDVVAGTVIVRR